MFCGNCGTELVGGVCPKCAPVAPINPIDPSGKFSRFFMSTSEKLVVALGNSYIANFLYNGSVERGIAVVSDKRVYFQGKNYYINMNANGKKKLIKNQQSRTVDLKDVTGTGMNNYANVTWKILSIVGVVLWVLLMMMMVVFGGIGARRSLLGTILPLLPLLFAVFCVFMYFKSKVSLVTIQYAGGEIGFDQKWFTQQEIDMFQRELRLAKDRAIEASENAVANKLQEAVSHITQPVAATSSKADELCKLADLLQRGAITQEEFDKMKKDLI